MITTLSAMAAINLCFNDFDCSALISSSLSLSSSSSSTTNKSYPPSRTAFCSSLAETIVVSNSTKAFADAKFTLAFITPFCDARISSVLFAHPAQCNFNTGNVFFTTLFFIVLILLFYSYAKIGACKPASVTLFIERIIKFIVLHFYPVHHTSSRGFLLLSRIFL